MVYIGSKIAAAAVALFLTWLIKLACNVSWTRAAIIYLLIWTVLYDGRILQATYETHVSKDTTP